MTARQLRYSYEDYLRVLDESEIKLEYSAGLIYAMAGGTLAHAELSVAVSTLLRQALPRTCSVFSSDAKIRVEATDFAGFPDVSVVCGDRQTSRVDPNALINPTLIIEVTSRSTEDYDRGEKLQHYQRLPSVVAVWFVSHRERAVTLVERQGSRWAERVVRAGERLVLSAPPLSLIVDELYGAISLEP